MVNKFILSAIITAFICLILALQSVRSRNKIGLMRSLFNAIVIALIGFEWLYVGTFFIINPDEFPANKDEIRLMIWVIIPLLFQIPFGFGIMLHIAYAVLRKIKDK